MSLQGFYTERGLALAGKLAAGTKLTVTRVTAGSGETADNAMALSQEKQTLTVGAAAAEGNLATLHATLTEAGASADYALTELGVYARDPDAGEILYQVFTLEEGRNIRAGGENVYRFYLKEAVGEDGIEVLCAPAGLVTEAELASAVAKKPNAVLSTTTLHVAKTGSDVTGDGSEGNPFLTIQKAVNSLPKLLLGRVILQIHEGTYDENVVISHFVYNDDFQVKGAAGETVQIKTLLVDACAAFFYFSNFTLSGNSGNGYNWSMQCIGAHFVDINQVQCVGAVASSSYGALRFDSCSLIRMRNTTISNKAMALDVAASVVYLDNTVTGESNTVAIRCGSGFGHAGGYVQKGGASIAGEEQKGYGGQIW